MFGLMGFLRCCKTFSEDSFSRGCVRGACETSDPRKCKPARGIQRQEWKPPTIDSPSAPGNPSSPSIVA